MIWIDVGTESSEASSIFESTSFKSFHFLPTIRRPSILSFSMRRSRSSQNTTNQDKRRLSLEDKELQPPKLGGERSKSISNFSRWQPAHWELNPFHKIKFVKIVNTHTQWGLAHSWNLKTVCSINNCLFFLVNGPYHIWWLLMRTEPSFHFC